MGTLASPAVVLPMRRALVLGFAAALVALPGAVGLGWVVGGAPAAWGALLGLAVPVGFLSVTAAVAIATARLDPTRMAAAVLGSWLLKILALVAVLAALQGADFYSRGAFFLAFLVGTAGYLVLEALVVVRTRTPYLEPDGS